MLTEMRIVGYERCNIRMFEFIPVLFHEELGTGDDIYNTTYSYDKTIALRAQFES